MFIPWLSEHLTHPPEVDSARREKTDMGNDENEEVKKCAEIPISVSE